MKAAITSLLLAAVVVLSEARVGPLRHLSKGECPSITNKQDFSIPPYLGTWYEIERLEAGFEEGMDCVRKEYDDSIVEGVVEMRFKGRNADGNFVELVGLATMSEPGVFLVEFPDGNLGAYHVLDTDYKTFAALYNCNQIGDLRLTMKAAITSLLLAAVVVLSEARAGPLRHLSKGECPSITNKQNFTIPLYLGTWYEIERFESGFEEGMDCVHKEYVAKNETLEMRFMARTAKGGFTELVTLATMMESGVFLVYFPDGSLGSYHVLDTDYKTFAALYNCAQFGDLRDEVAWIHSRNTTLDKMILDRAHQVFEHNGIDINLFQATYQGKECGY